MSGGPTPVARPVVVHQVLPQLPHNSNRLFVAIPMLKKNEDKVPFLSAAGWTTPAEALSWGKDQLKQYGRKFKLKTTVREF